MKSILTITMNPCVDMSSHIEEVIPEEKLRCDKPHFDPGGGGINVSQVIKRLGGSSLALYCSGGANGNFLEELLERDLLERKSIKIEGWTRQNFTLFENKSCDQFRFGMPGPALKESEWQEFLKFVSSLIPLPAYIVISGSFPPGVPATFIAQLAQLIKNTESRLIVDTSGEALRAATKEGVYLMKPNLREFSDILGRKYINDHELEECCKEFVGRGFCEVLMLSLGEKGALLATASKVKRIISPSVISKSKIGAGDSMVGGIVFGLANDYGLYKSAVLGVAAGTAAVLTEGTGLCLKEDVFRFYNEMKGQNNGD